MTDEGRAGIRGMVRGWRAGRAVGGLGETPRLSGMDRMPEGFRPPGLAWLGAFEAAVGAATRSGFPSRP